MDTQFVEEIEMLHSRASTALADPTRLLLLYSLMGKSRNVTELAADLEIPQPTLSRHLAILRERSLVTALRKGTMVYYSLTDHRVIDALDLLRALVHDHVLFQAHLSDFTALEQRIQSKGE